MSETLILAKNLIKSYFEEVGYEATPILDKFDKLIGKYLKGASCDACLTNLHGYLNEMWDKGLNEKLIHEFIEELTKYVDEAIASKINKGLKFTESLGESNRSLKESKDEYDIKYDLVINALRLCWKADLILEDTYKRYKNKSVKIKNIDDAYNFAYTILYGKENDMLKAFHELMNLLHIEDFEKHFDL